MERHLALASADRGAARADDEVGLARKDGIGQQAHLGGVVGTVGFHEDHDAGAAVQGRASSGKARIAVAAPGLAQQHAAGALDVRGSLVGRAVVDEDRPVEQVERAQLGEQRR
jgi:hypothetical protein